MSKVARRKEWWQGERKLTVIVYDDSSIEIETENDDSYMYFDLESQELIDLLTDAKETES